MALFWSEETAPVLFRQWWELIEINSHQPLGIPHLLKQFHWTRCKRLELITPSDLNQYCIVSGAFLIPI